MESEQIIIDKICSAFTIQDAPSDEWILSNPYIFEEISVSQAISYLPAYMIFVLRNMRNDPQSVVYMQLLFTLNEYSKCKDPDNLDLGLWFLLNKSQKHAVMAFLGHILHNQHANIDEEELRIIINRWKDT